MSQAITAKMAVPHGLAVILQALFSVAAHGPIPFWGRIPRKIKELTSGWKYDQNFPDYLNPALESRLHLRARWEAFQRPLTSPHPVRPEGYASMLIPLWQAMFESFDAGWTGASVELRHPYVDLRMLRFLLAVPALPWCRSKHLLRRAMRGVLPRAVLRRGKEGVPPAPGRNGRTNLPLFPLYRTRNCAITSMWAESRNALAGAFGLLPAVRGLEA